MQSAKSRPIGCAAICRSVKTGAMVVRLVADANCDHGCTGAERRSLCPETSTRVLRLGPRRLFARPGCLVVDRDTRRTQPSQQYSSYRGRIESNILGVWWMCLTALQSE